ncbi:MAG: zf-TFIIB domain-containing protein [Desulfobacula sp.]|nr:zf-TFIIB domain-containing protein [Desulfobacula sp.]
MKCPVCKTNDLMMSDRQGVEIDYCPECRGVWLDRGELDKIIERSLASAAPLPSAVPEQSYREADHFSSHDKKHGHGHDDHHDSKHGYGKSYKKKSFLKDIFDF